MMGNLLLLLATEYEGPTTFTLIRFVILCLIAVFVIMLIMKLLKIL